MTLFDAPFPRGPQGGAARADVVVRSPAPAAGTGPFLSVVVVAEGAREEIERHLAVLDAALSVPYPVHEIVLVLPHARGQQAWCRALADRQANLQVLGLVQDARDEVAFTAGLDGALGDVVVTAHLGLDSPEDILRCAGMIGEETAVVVGVDTAAAGGRKLALRVSRAVARRSLGEDVATVSLGLRGYARTALDAWLPRRDRDRVLRLLPFLSGYPCAVMEYAGGTAHRHRSSSSLRQVTRSIFYASARPLRVAVGLAVLASLGNMIYALYVVAVELFHGAVAGWTSMSLQMSIMFLLLSVVIAIMAEFMFQSNETANERPIYRVAFERTSPVLAARDMLNVDTEAVSGDRVPGSLERAS